MVINDMYIGKGQVVELLLDDGNRHARISCDSNLIPSPGQYLVAGTASQSDHLPVPLFSTESITEGFIACAPVPVGWIPGTEVYIRGPLGRGFSLPQVARKVALVAFDDSPARLRVLMLNALKQGAAVVLICDTSENLLPDDVEIQPLSALGEILTWADYTAFDVTRENLLGLRLIMDGQNQIPINSEAQTLVRMPMPCGGVADCGVCAVSLKSKWKLACKDGPVFNWDEI
ncbi:MAG TPA: hypothetical protein DCX53_10365 [Anaerolineae bacterium]|nr:hypothetical protein [Anaerolineae bacterium]